MVAVVSIGIESGKGSLEEIPCAFADAARIYNMFDKALGNNLKRSASICVKNISTIECKAIISALSLTMEKEDIVIFFFSGHGIKSVNGRLQLVFSDYSGEDKKGTIFLEEIVLSLKNYNCPIFIILDCCYSGSGIPESIQNDYKLESNISIMTSNGPAGRDEACKEGSHFTNALCKALEQILDTEQRVSISNIFSYAEKYNPQSRIMIGGGKSDLILNETERMKYPHDFSKVFTNKIQHINYEMREALWYSVGYLPIEIKIDILVYYLKEHQNGCMELSWRVRRAIGSVFVYGNNMKIDECIIQLLHSDRWTDKCIGYICARKSRDQDIMELMYKDLKDSEKEYPMDLVWLLALYLSDRQENIDTDAILNSKLMQSAWGVMEVWKRYFNEYDTNTKLQLFKDKINENIYKQLCVELYLKGQLSDCEQFADEKYISFIKELYQCKTRGRSNISEKGKWIFSVLYGNWRDQVDVSSVFEKQWKNERNKKSLLRALQYIPSVEIKMAVLDYISRIIKGNNNHIDVNCLKWALKDSHPWVIRTALPLFQGEQEIVKRNIRKNIDMKIYPGVFDLAIELSKQELDDFEYPIVQINDFETEMLDMAISREKHA